MVLIKNIEHYNIKSFKNNMIVIHIYFNSAPFASLR